MDVGLLFGSFNPVHVGHLIIANTILECTPLKEIWFVISPHNPLKSKSTLLHHFDRYELVKLAIEDNYAFRASDIEFSLPQPSYTIDTLTHLQEKHPGHSFKLIIGEDNLNQLPRWKNYEKILEYFGLYYYQRPGSGMPLIKDHPNIIKVEAPLLDISATFIRKAVKEKRSIKYLVPSAVENYILYKKFYF